MASIAANVGNADMQIGKTVEAIELGSRSEDEVLSIIYVRGRMLANCISRSSTGWRWEALTSSSRSSKTQKAMLPRCVG